MESHFHIQCSCMTTANQRGLNKPNEDYYLTDEANRIYMVHHRVFLGKLL